MQMLEPIKQNQIVKLTFRGLCMHLDYYVMKPPMLRMRCRNLVFRDVDEFRQMVPNLFLAVSMGTYRAFILFC